MNNKLVHDAAVTITEQRVINHNAYPLVRELAFAYGTQVIHASEHPTNPKLYLAREDGICVGYVSHTESDGYGFRSVVATKERGGRRADDRYTWYSSKLASLMRTIKKENLIPPNSDKLVQEEQRILNSVVGMVSSFGDTRKQSSLPGNDSHVILEIAFGNRSIHELSTESIAKYKEYLDKYRYVDTIREKRTKAVEEFYREPVWAVCYDMAQSFLVGRLQITPTLDHNHHGGASSIDVKIAQPFKRVPMLDEFPEIMPKITMLKVYSQQKDGIEFHKDVIPKNITAWLPDLDVMAYSARSSWDEGILKGDWLLFKA